MKLTNEDFMYLHECSMEWEESWKIKANNFEPRVKSYEWRWGYWFESYVALLFGKQFLEEQGYEFEFVFDLANSQWLLLTNYESIESKGDEVEED
jgi:hypothetical protein